MNQFKIGRRMIALMAAFALMSAGAAQAADNGARGAYKSGEKSKKNAQQSFFMEGPNEEQVNQLLETWPETPKEVAQTTIEKYGLPHEATANMLVWRDNGPWKRTIVRREEIPHNFPVPHTDVIEQFVNYQVPPDKLDELAQYDGSVIVDRTRGEISARCDREEANFLALNLANDIINDEKSVEEARQEYGRVIMLSMAGQTPPLMEKLQFKTKKNTGFKDEALKELKGQMKNGNGMKTQERQQRSTQETEE